LEGGLHCATNPVILPSRRQAESRMAGDSNPHCGLTPRERRRAGGGACKTRRPDELISLMNSMKNPRFGSKRLADKNPTFGWGRTHRRL
jgi:hypothetical protein